MDFNRMKIMVLGAGRSGISAAILLDKLGAEVTLCDNKGLEQFGDSLALVCARGIRLHLGMSAEDLVKFQQLIIVSPGIPLSLPLFNIAAQYNVKVWGEVELAFNLTPCPVIAITGTNGKTTTSSLLGEILKQRFFDVHVVGNIGVPYTQNVLSLSNKSFAVVEISSFQLETIENFHPRISAILNISPDHLDRHKSLDNYIHIKEQIFSNQEKYDFTILNYDDPICYQMVNKTHANVFFFSTHHILNEGIFLKDNFIHVKWGALDCDIININDLLILGMHNVENAMASSAAAICAGVDISDIKAALSRFKGVAHRIELVRSLNGVDFYNDSKGTNPDSSIRAICAMRKPVILIAGGYDKNSVFDDFVNSFFDKVKYLVVIGQTSDKIIETAKKYGFSKYCKAGSLIEAIDIAFDNASDGDCVLLSPACASWDMFLDYEQRGTLFCEYVNKL